MTKLVIPSGSKAVRVSEKPTKFRCMLFADTGVGKTYFSLMYAPSPVLLISLDDRADMVVKEVETKGRQVALLKIIPPSIIVKDGPINTDLKPDDDPGAKAARIAANEQIKLITEEIPKYKGLVKSVVYDTGSEVNDMLNLCYGGGIIDQVLSNHGKIRNVTNVRARSLYSLASYIGANLIITARQKEIYRRVPGGQDKATGKFNYRDAHTAAESVDWSAHLRIVKPVGKDPYHELEIVKSLRLDEIGQVYNTEQWNTFGGGNPLAFINSVQYGTDLERWL